jgi:LuxR family maltose regulon positive regulatory protein
LLAGAYLSDGNAVAASQAYAEAVALSQTPSTLTLALIAGGRLVWTQALQGQLHQAAETYRCTCELATEYGVLATPALGVAQVGMGEVRREWNDLDAAEDLLRQGIARCRESSGQGEMALDGCLALARVLQARGDPAGALVVLQQAEDLGHDRRVPQYPERVAVARARLWLTSTPGDGAAVRRWAGAREDAWRAAESTGYVGLLERLTVARLYMTQGRRDDAALLLESLLKSAEAGGLVGCAIEILAVQARLSLEQQRVAQAMLVLSCALTLAEPAGYVRVFVDEGAPMVALLRQAQARGVLPAYVAMLLTACGSGMPAGPAPAAPALVEPLSARELELLRLLAAGLSTPEIAAQLFITAGTVRNHLKRINGKLAVHTRLQAVERAQTLSLL